MNFLKDLAAQHSNQNSGSGGSQVAHPTGALQGAEPTKSGGDGGLMGKLAGVMGGSQNQVAHPTGAVQGAQPTKSGGGGLFGKLNEAMGGGKSSEAKEGASAPSSLGRVRANRHRRAHLDYVDKGASERLPSSSRKRAG